MFANLYGFQNLGFVFCDLLSGRLRFRCHVFCESNLNNLLSKLICTVLPKILIYINLHCFFFLQSLAMQRERELKSWKFSNRFLLVCDCPMVDVIKFICFGRGWSRWCFLRVSLCWVSQCNWWRWRYSSFKSSVARGML